jgi:hypothetical protein
MLRRGEALVPGYSHDGDTNYIGRGDRMVRSDCIGRPDRHYRAALPLDLY